jgi:hypothetical protein
MIVCKYVSPKNMMFLVPEWPHKIELIYLSNVKMSKNHTLRMSYFESIPTKIIQNLSKLYLHSNLEGILKFLASNSLQKKW